MSLAIDDDVLRFQITIEHLLRMQVSDGGKRLQEIEFGLCLFHSLHFPQQVEEFSAVAVLHAEDEAVLCFKAHVEFGDEGVAIAFLEDGPFALHDSFLLVLKDEVFVDDLHGHEHAESPNKVNFRESTCSEAFDDFKVIE